MHMLCYELGAEDGIGHQLLHLSLALLLVSCCHPAAKEFQELCHEPYLLVAGALLEHREINTEAVFHRHTTQGSMLQIMNHPATLSISTDGNKC
jgi:hypothetical protein